MPDFGNTFQMIQGSPRRLTKEELVRAIRFMIAAEYEAVQLYMQIAEATSDPLVSKVLVEISDEERVHAGEFLRLLDEIDPSENIHYTEGAQEVENIIMEFKKENRKNNEE